ncbi:hypothetical protein [Avibacterium avium]|uniref:hypothetical protein n=1 Tax=Avibacterium avium TaxID=751 RepID=UPI003BF7CA19
MNRENGIFKDEEEERDYLAERQRVIQELRYQHYQYSVQQIKKEMSQKIERETSRIGLTEQQRDALKVIQEEFKLHMDIELRGVENLLNFSDSNEGVKNFFHENNFSLSEDGNGNSYFDTQGNSQKLKDFNVVSGAGIGIASEGNNKDGVEKIADVAGSTNAKTSIEQIKFAASSNGYNHEIKNSTQKTSGKDDGKSNKEKIIELIPDYENKKEFEYIRNSKVLESEFLKQIQKAKHSPEGLTEDNIKYAIDFTNIEIAKKILKTDATIEFKNFLADLRQRNMNPEDKELALFRAKEAYRKNITEWAEENGIDLNDRGIRKSIEFNPSIPREIKESIYRQSDLTQDQENKEQHSIFKNKAL